MKKTPTKKSTTKKPAAKKEKKPAAKMGAPKVWNPEVEAKLLMLISTSDKGLRRLCRENPDLPSVQTIYEELYSNKDFAERYARARTEQAEFMADQIIEIADEVHGDFYVDPVTGKEMVNHENIQRSRLRVEARKWIASKLHARVYGDKVENKVTQTSKIVIEGASTEELNELLSE